MPPPKKRPPRRKSLEQQAKDDRKPPRRTPKRTTPKRLTAAQKVKRDNGLVRDRLVNDMSWTSLATKYGIEERSCRRILAEWRRNNASSLDEVDATGELWETLQAYEAQIERLRSLRDKAFKDNNLNAVLGAERQMTTVREAKFAKLQEADMIPKNLGTFKHVFEFRHLVEQVFVVLDKIEAEEIEPADARKLLLPMLSGDPSQN